MKKEKEFDTVLIDEIKPISFFSMPLSIKESIAKVLWDIIKNIIYRLGFVDYVIYTLDKENQNLVQHAT